MLFYHLTYHSSHFNDFASGTAAASFDSASPDGPSPDSVDVNADDVPAVSVVETTLGATSVSSLCARSHSIAGSTPLLFVNVNAF